MSVKTEADALGIGDGHLHIAGWESEEGIPKDLREELLNAQAELHKQRSNWMGTKVLYMTLHNVLEDTTLTKRQLDELREKVTQAEVSFCTQNCQSMSRQMKPSPSLTEAENSLRSLVEKDIKNTCEELVDYHDRSSSEADKSSTVFAARAMNLGEILKEEKKNLEMCYRELIDVQKTEKELYSSCMKELTQLADILTKVIVKYRVKIQPKIDDGMLSNLLSRCEALSLKATTMTLKLQKELYTPDSIASLQLIRTELMKCKKEKHQEIVAIEKQLGDFKNLSDDFNAIVAEYNQLQIDIEKREWALKKLHQQL